MYASALLDAYMDYKVMWRNIQTAAWEVEQGQSELIAKSDIPELADMFGEANKHYAKQLEDYNRKLLEFENEQQSQAVNSASNVQAPASEPVSQTTSTATITPPTVEESTTLPVVYPTLSHETVAIFIIHIFDNG